MNINKKYLYPYGVKPISKFQQEYSIKEQIGGGGQATVWSVSQHTNTTQTPKCAKLFKIDMTEFKKSIKAFHKIIVLYHMINMHKLSDYYGIYGNCDTESPHKWTGIIILMKKYHHTLSDKKYWLKTCQITEMTETAQITQSKYGETDPIDSKKQTEGIQNKNEIKTKAENNLIDSGYMCGNNWRFIAKLIGDLLNHLQRMHNVNIIHNDIKPDNIVFDTDENVWKFIDFDLCMKVEKDGLEGYITHYKYRGSPYYSAPEISIYSNKSQPCIYSKAADVFAFGMVIAWCVLQRNHIWFFIYCLLNNGSNKVQQKEKYVEYYFNEICKPKNENEANVNLLKCIKDYGMNRNMNDCIYQLLGNVLLFDLKQRKSVKYLKRIEIKENELII